jgi:hypothetical protein
MPVEHRFEDGVVGTEEIYVHVHERIVQAVRVTGKRAETLREMMLFIEMFTLQRAWNGLTDDELMWRPTADAWSVGPATECRTATPFVADALAADFDVGVVEAASVRRTSRPIGCSQTPTKRSPR